MAVVVQPGREKTVSAEPEVVVGKWAIVWFVAG
jgi:hypothetical protein